MSLSGLNMLAFASNSGTHDRKSKNLKPLNRTDYCLELFIKFQIHVLYTDGANTILVLN